MEGFPPEKDQAYQQAFDAFDKDKDGRLTLEELKICMRAVGENIDQGRLQATFVNYFRQKWQGLVGLDELQVAFSFFDPAGTGTVDASQELSWLLSNWGDQPLSQREVQHFTDEAGGARFNYRQFAEKLLRGGC